MDTTLTVRDLLLPGEPLDPAEVLAGASGLHNPVSWVVSLRPYPPAFPRLRGEELALVATEHLAGLDPPTTLADVVRQLLSRNAAGVAVRGEVDGPAIQAAEDGGLPLLLLHGDAPLHDIEQAIMRVCALYQARREMLPAEDPDAWVADLLAGRIATYAEAQSLARRQGYRLATHYAAAYLNAEFEMRNSASKPDSIPNSAFRTPHSDRRAFEDLEARLKNERKASSAALLVQQWGDGLAVLLPQGSEDALPALLVGSGLPCGIGREKPLLEASDSLAEAQLAAIASALLHGGEPVRFQDLGADRLLVLLYRDHPVELKAFVEENLGPLLQHDAGSATPILPTLQSFVAHGGRLRETASDIYVHRNTLAYRLDRASEILGVDLRDSDTRLSIELALRALPLVEIVREK
jgi:hypothetical protein